MQLKKEYQEGHHDDSDFSNAKSLSNYRITFWTKIDNLMQVLAQLKKCIFSLGTENEN